MILHLGIAIQDMILELKFEPKKEVAGEDEQEPE